MKHQKSRRKLNLSADHRKAFIRNQTMHLIMYGSLTTTHARTKEVRIFAEKLVTVAREGLNFNNWRRAEMMLPYSKKCLEKLFKEVAPQYVTRPGGYTRIHILPHRLSDTAKIARLSWV